MSFENTAPDATGAALIICANAPYPPTSGTPLRTWQTISLAARTRPVGVLSIGANDGGLDSIPGVVRWRHIDVSARERAPLDFPLLTNADSIELLESAFREMHAVLHPSVTIFSNIWPGRALRAAGANPGPTILDLHNAYSDYAAQTGGDERAAAGFESAAARCVDAIWACSDEDARALRRHCAPTEVVVIPNGVDLSAYAGIRDSSRAAGRSALTLLFVGSYWYEPNRIAAEALITSILPAVHAARPNVRLLLVGATPSAAMLAAAKADRRVVVTGRVPDVRPYLELADIIVAPLAAGAGTRLKLLEAFAARRPVVATTKAAEGLAMRDGIELLMRDDRAAFARALVELAELPERRHVLAANAHRRACELYGWDALAPRFADALAHHEA